MPQAAFLPSWPCPASGRLVLPLIALFSLFRADRGGKEAEAGEGRWRGESGKGKGDARGRKREGQGGGGGRRGQKESRPGRLSSVRPASRAAVTCSPAFAVPSAPRGLTSLFGMGRGGAPVLSPPWSFTFPGRAPQGRPSPLPRNPRGALCPRRRTSGSETRSATPRRRPSGRSRARACAPCMFSVVLRRPPLPRRRGDCPFPESPGY